MEGTPIIYPNMRYQLVFATSLSELQTEVEGLMRRGWQLSGSLTIKEPTPTLTNIVATPRYYREMVYIDTTPAEDEDNECVEDEQKRKWDEAYRQLPQKLRDLLAINNVQIMLVDGKPYTRVGNKVIMGITPTVVLQELREGDHFPINIADEEILTPLEGFIQCAF